MPALRLLSTDFDGTLISYGSDGRCRHAFAEVLRRHRRAGGLWAVNTGRGFEHALEGLKHFDAPVDPDFLLTNERAIYRNDGRGGWKSHDEWNRLCDARHVALFEEARDVVRQICERAEASPDMTLLIEEGEPVGLLTSTEELMGEVVAWIDALSRPFPDFFYQRNTVYLRFCHRAYHKGSALGEVCRIAQIDRLHVLAAGDQYNDIPMLDGRYAAFPCCPSNAIGPVREAVLAAGGYVASRPASDGIADAWTFFTELP